VPAQPEAAPLPPAGAPAATGGTPAPSVPVSAPSAQPAPAAATAATAQPTPTTGPATAADQDVIEKEWVDKADEVVAKTAGQPHAEEDAVEDLQIDYLKKRYGKDVAKS